MDYYIKIIMKVLNILLIICLVINYYSCLKIKESNAFLNPVNANENEKFTFENQWDQTTISEVDIDDVFMEISDKNLESVEKIDNAFS